MTRKESLVSTLGGETDMDLILLPQEEALIKRTSREIFRLASKRLSFSETRSIYSHLPMKHLSFRIGGLRNLSSKEALGIALVNLYIPSELKFLIRVELQELCYHKRYEGLWMLVHKILEHESEIDALFVLHILENYNSRDIFGNLLPLALKRLEKLELYDPYLHRRVKKPQRKRGYTDHGSRKESHRWLPKEIHLGPNEKRNDLREIPSIHIRDRQLGLNTKLPFLSRLYQQLRRNLLNEKQADSSSD